MNTHIRYLHIAVIAVAALVTAQANASENAHDDCGGTTTIQVDKMGAVNEAGLNNHIVQTEKSLKMMHGKNVRGGENRDRLRTHLAAMETALRRLHDRMYEGGCTGARHGASLEARVTVLERHSGTMKEMAN